MDNAKAFLRNELQKYAFHFLIFLCFLFATGVLYTMLQNVMVNAFSSVKYQGSNKGTEVFLMIFIFAVVCYGINYGMLRKFNLKEYAIIYLLLPGLLILPIANLAMLIYYNVEYSKAGRFDLNLLNNGFAILFVFAMVDRGIRRFLTKARPMHS